MRAGMHVRVMCMCLYVECVYGRLLERVHHSLNAHTHARIGYVLMCISCVAIILCQSTRSPRLGHMTGYI